MKIIQVQTSCLLPRGMHCVIFTLSGTIRLQLKHTDSCAEVVTLSCVCDFSSGWTQVAQLTRAATIMHACPWMFLCILLLNIYIVSCFISCCLLILLGCRCICKFLVSNYALQLRGLDEHVLMKGPVQIYRHLHLNMHTHKKARPGPEPYCLCSLCAVPPSGCCGCCCFPWSV